MDFHCGSPLFFRNAARFARVKCQACPERSRGVQSEDFLGTTKFLNQEVIGAFTPLKNFDAQTVGILSLTTTPGELLRDANATNRLTMLIVFAIAVSLIIPLYRFTVFLTS